MKEYAEIDDFIKKHYSTLYTTALKFVKSTEIAQDITQEIIIQFWNNKITGITPEKMDHYLFSMVRNESLNYLRSIKRETLRYSKIEQNESEEPEIFNLLLEEETNQMLLSAISTLPEQSARIAHLVLSGYENKEIARLLGISINTVKTLKYTAIRKLREYFNKMNIEKLY